MSIHGAVDRLSRQSSRTAINGDSIRSRSSPPPSATKQVAFEKDHPRWQLPPAKGVFGSFGQSFRAPNVKRWDGAARVTKQWDGLRKDSELWFPEGDCLVYLYGRGQSHRGPSFQLPFAAIQSANCAPLLERYSVQSQGFPESPMSATSNSSSESEYFNGSNGSTKYEIYIPAPSNCSKEESFHYHVTTRNFFAWLFCKPVVGTYLGKSLVALLERMDQYRSPTEDNVKDVMEYLEEESYADFRECPDHALAVLYFAEKQEQRELWIDAFCHCVGMHDQLISSKEFELIDRVSKALITRARLEMDIRIEHAGRQLTSFLDNELSGTYLGIGNHARAHLERFRSFLHSYYVGKFGYWPPQQQKGEKGAISKSICRSMYVEFRSLYEYLVDEESSNSMETTVKLPSGGLCVLQNVAAFDKRHKHQSLLHPLPLVPQEIQQRGTSQRTLDARMLSRTFSRAAKVDKRLSTLAALSAATNSYDVTVMECPLVRSYMRFEKESTMKADEKVTAADARKVRWILVYAILQTLISITRAPAEVRDTENVSYNLCCQVAGTPPWAHGGSVEKSMSREKSFMSREKSVASRSACSSYLSADTLYSQGSSVSVPSLTEDAPSPSSVEDQIEIVPDIDYLSQQPTAIRGRVDSIKSPQPRRLASSASWCEILIHGYGNGTLTTTTSSRQPPVSASPSEPISPVSNKTTSTSSQPYSSRWSLTTDEDEDVEDDDKSLPDMDHPSVNGDGSNPNSPTFKVEDTEKPLRLVDRITQSIAERGELYSQQALKPRSLSVRRSSSQTALGRCPKDRLYLPQSVVESVPTKI
ncbi:MAG: hypothetical protein M4579_000848 [Chaenotheca gracillima]|nr:MAG: hypothetical protein M4579_000848 [Chaenotheca gracillima]